MSGRTIPRAVPLLYLGTAHVSLALAAVLAAARPHAFAGFFYHSWMVALVHLVTLGWITFSILGAFYIVGPLALRTTLAPRRADYVAYAFGVIGLVGMVSHFWIEEYGGMAWSAATITSGVLYMTVRIVAAARRAVVHPAVKLHIVLACVNFWIAASAGVLIAFDKVGHFLPGFVLSNVFAHAHLAAIGWATMMVAGVGYRLLPMTLPSKIPAGGSMYASALLLEIGVLGLFVTLLVQSAWSLAFGLAIVAGLGAFAWHVVWMLSTPASKPVGAPRVDFGVLHAAAAGVWLFAAATIGVVLLVTPMSPRTLHAAGAYGVAGLVGFLAQMVVAMEARVLPLAVWCWTYAGSDFRVQPPSPHVMRDRSIQALVFCGWTIGVPALAAGLAFESASIVAVGAWSLAAAIVMQTVDLVSVLARPRRHQSRLNVHAELEGVPGGLDSGGSRRTAAAPAAQTPDPPPAYSIEYSNVAMLRTASGVDAVTTLAERGADWLSDEFTGDLFVRRSAGGRAARIARWVFFDFFLENMGSTIAHEYGHAARIEESGRRAKVFIRSFDNSFVRVLGGGPLTAGESMSIFSGGFEGAAVLDERVENRILARGSATPGELGMLLLSAFGTETYILSALSEARLASPDSLFNGGRPGIPGDPVHYTVNLAAKRLFAPGSGFHDVRSFFPEIQSTARSIRRRSLLSLVDYEHVTTTVGLVRDYMWNGDRRIAIRWIEAGPVSLMPALGYRLTPVGPELQVKTRYKIEAGVGRVYVRWTERAALDASRLVGIGGDFDRARGDRFTPKAAFDLWRNPDGTTSARGEVGATLARSARDRLVFSAALGAKGRGYVLGHPIAPGPYFSIGGGLRF